METEIRSSAEPEIGGSAMSGMIGFLGHEV